MLATLENTKLEDLKGCYIGEMEVPFDRKKTHSIFDTQWCILDIFVITFYILFYVRVLHYFLCGDNGT